MKLKFAALLLLAVAAAVPATRAQDGPTFVEEAGNKYWIRTDAIYDTENGHASKLDVIYPHVATAPVPAVIYIHGGGWIWGDKAGAVLETLPYLKMGWAAINVEYRMADVSKAPGAVEDCRCALKWVVRNAKEYHIDPTRLVVTGHSAGGHLALTTGLLMDSDGRDNNCPLNPGEAEPRVAAIVNWYGPTDVNDLIKGPNTKNYAQMWLGSLANKEEIARESSPLTYVRKENPPVITIHGDKDSVVPYSHAVRLHDALDKAGVPNQLYTVKGGGHGQFTAEDDHKAYEAVWQFLSKLNLGPVK